MAAVVEVVVVKIMLYVHESKPIVIASGGARGVLKGAIAPHSASSASHGPTVRGCCGTLMTVYPREY